MILSIQMSLFMFKLLAGKIGKYIRARSYKGKLCCCHVVFLRVLWKIRLLECVLFFANFVVSVTSLLFFIISGKTNKEFNMRHDWNSLLSDDESLLMTRYSKKFFPNADDLVSDQD